MKKIASLSLLMLLAPILSPLAESFHLEKTYSYASEESVQPLQFEAVLDQTASLSKSKQISLWKKAQGKVDFATGKNMFTLKIPMTFEFESHRDDIRVVLSVHGKEIPLTIDEDGDGRNNGYYYTEPAFFDAAKDVTYTVETKNNIAFPALSVVGLDTEEHTSHVAFEVPKAHAEGLNIITRAEWGANESLRYEDNPEWVRILAKIEANKNLPKSDATLQYEARMHKINQHLATEFPEQDKAIERITTENGHTLVWPIEKTKKVERIVIHHTANDNTTSKDDLTLIRGIYQYHTISRGWGDIGYNYLVWQRGQIYEGRAGWDYNVAAHALWNNKSTVWVSVMGNFMVDSIVTEQEESIKNIIEFLSLKYGIDLHGSSTGHRECKGDCVIEDFDAPNLSWHGFVGFTSCPGTHMLSLVEKIRKEDTRSVGRTQVTNPDYFNIQIASNAPDIPDPKLNKGPTVRIRLSYTGSTIKLKSGDGALPRLVLGSASGTLRKDLELPFEASGTSKIALVLGKKKYPFSRVEFSGNLVTITNWNRKPSWDSSGLMNDNVFRGKIVLLNEGGKLVVVNELPLEDYLRGLAEVSNGDPEEKIKTILVAARSYAYFYSFPENRKFPGKAYDGSDNPDEFQKYLGYGYEKRSPQSMKLIDQTNGQIITYDGKFIKPWYFSESSGQTISYVQYCEDRKANGTLAASTVCTDTPYLQSVTDPGGVGHTLKGHGVGISWIGATYLATNMEMNYEQIIGYYLTGVKVEKKY